MTNRLGHTLQQRIPVLAGVSACPFPSKFSVACAIDFAPQLSRTLKNRTGGRGTPRRLVLGIGAALWGQFMSMAGNRGSKSFLASARQKGAVEQVNLHSRKPFLLSTVEFLDFLAVFGFWVL